MRRRRAEMIAALLLVGLATCGDLDNVTVEQTGQSTIPQRTVLDQVLGPVDFAGFGNFDITQSQEFQNQGYKRSEIDSVRISLFKIAVSSPADGNLDFLESVSFFIEADGLPRTRIAMLASVPDGVREIELDIDDVELADYVAAASVHVTQEASGVRPEQQTVLDGTIRFNVDINVSGAAGCSAAR